MMSQTKEWALNTLGKWRAVEGHRDSLAIIDRTKEQIENGSDLNEVLKDMYKERTQTLDHQTRNTLLFTKAVIQNVLNE